MVQFKSRMKFMKKCIEEDCMNGSIGLFLYFFVVITGSIIIALSIKSFARFSLSTSKRIANLLIYKINVKSHLYIFEILLLILSACLLISCFLIYKIKFAIIIFLVICMVFIFCLDLFHQLKNYYPDYDSRISVKMQKVLKFIKYLSSVDNYFINRGIMLFIISKSLFFHLISCYILVVGALIFVNVPSQISYTLLLSLPICLISWIYLVDNSENKQEFISFKRLITRFITFIVVLWILYLEYDGYINNHKFDREEYFIYLLYLTIFISLDNLSKLIYEDYLLVKKQN